jgi:hypothetical protein
MPCIGARLPHADEDEAETSLAIGTDVPAGLLLNLNV